MMKHAAIGIAVVLAIACQAHAQQYGWQVIAIPRLGGYQMHAVDFVDSLHGWCEAGAQVYLTRDGGHTWMASVTQPFAVSSISMSDSLHGWAVGNLSPPGGPYEARILHTNDGGVNWTAQVFGFDRQYYDVSASSNQSGNVSGISRVWTVRDTGRISQTNNAGATWTERTVLDSIGYLGKIQFIDSLHGWITYLPSSFSEMSAGVLRTIDGGASWEAVSTPRGLTDISFVDSLHGWGSSYTSSSIFNVVKTTDGGNTWQIIYTSTDALYFEAISFVDTLSGWVFGSTFYQGGSRELIMRTSDGGNTWIWESVGKAGALSNGQMIDGYHGWAVSYEGEVLSYGVTTDVPEHLPELPAGYALRQNYPNPFNNATVIEYEIPKQSDVNIAIYDGLGKLVVTLVHQRQTSGVYRIQFDAGSLSSGTYYYTMETESFRNTKQLILIK